MTSAAGRGTVSRMSLAAVEANGRRPRSFQARMNGLVVPPYATAARADAKASRLPEHSRQRATGHAVGAPQSSQIGGTIRTSEPKQASQANEPERPQEAQRCGRTRSRSHS